MGDFLRQLANLTEKQFSYSSPILDVSFSRYRLNAVYQSLARSHNEKTYTFSLRLASSRCRIAGDSNFFGGESKRILLGILSEGGSIVIGGRTSSGETELEKYLLGEMAPSSRVIVIDNVEELDLVENPRIDLTMWLVNEAIKEASFSSLIRNALRNNPDYIMGLENRRKVLARMTAFVRNADIRYSAIWIDKKHQGDNVSISQGLAKQMKSVIKAHYDEFLSYDVVKVYYDNGQSQVSVLISSVFTVLLDKVEIRKVFPSDYRLFQAADLIATLKLLHLQIENGKATRSEKVFFGSDRNLEKDYLKGIQKKEWSK